jgi:hypothetical protein
MVDFVITQSVQFLSRQRGDTFSKGVTSLPANRLLKPGPNSCHTKLGKSGFSNISLFLQMPLFFQFVAKSAV